MSTPEAPSELHHHVTSGDHRRLFLHLISGFRRVDILIVESRHAQDLASVTLGFTYARYNPSARPPWWCFQFWLYRMFKVSEVPRSAKSLVAIAKVLRVSAIVSSDAFDPLHLAASHLFGVHLYMVQHGIYIDQRRLAVKRKPEIEDKPSRVTLFALGEYDIHNYRKRGFRPQRIIPCGTLKNSVYSLSKSNSDAQQTIKFDICIVEKGIVLSPNSPLDGLRLKSWKSFFLALDLFCQQFKPRVIIALSNGDQSQAVLAWIKRHFSANFETTDDIDVFATYKVVDYSNLTIGQGSTVLCEALSRGKKILSVDYTGTGFWTLPGNGIFQLESPTPSELSQRIHKLLRIDWETYRQSLPPELLELVVNNPRAAVSTISATITADIARPS